MNGRALVDLKDESGAVDRAAPASCSTASRQLRDDGTTSSRLLDLLGLLHREGQPDGAARCDRPARAGHRAELGVGVAGQPADPVQPRQRRSGRASPGIRAKPIIEWNGSQWVGIDVPDYAPTTKPSDGGRSVHHERRGRRAPVRPRPDGGRPVPRALRAVRIAVAERPASEGPHQSGRARVRRRQGGLRHRAGLPLCRAPPTG